MNKKEILKNLFVIKEKLDYISSAIEVISDSCIYNEHFLEYDVLKNVLHKVYDIYRNFDYIDMELIDM